MSVETYAVTREQLVRLSTLQTARRRGGGGSTRDRRIDR